MGPSPRAPCRCFGTAVASADGLLCVQRWSRGDDGEMERRREREIERLPRRRLEQEKQKGGGEKRSWVPRFQGAEMQRSQRV